MTIGEIYQEALNDYCARLRKHKIPESLIRLADTKIREVIFERAAEFGSVCSHPDCYEWLDPTRSKDGVAYYQRKWCDEHRSSAFKIGGRRDVYPGQDGRLARHGYIMVRREPEERISEHDGTSVWIAEHRRVMAQKLGRLLKRGESVHHKDGVRSNNHPDNQT